MREVDMEVKLNVSQRFTSYLTDWDYYIYLLIGGYGSGKSRHTGLKLILKLMSEKRTALVVRNVKETIKDSCFSLLRNIIEELQGEDTPREQKIVIVQSPMEIRFSNGSKIIFRGLDNKEKIKSIHDVSIVWVEECSEINFDTFNELLGRVRMKGVSLHVILTCNPVGKENWVYDTFFVRRITDPTGKVTQKVICNEHELYKRKTMICKVDELIVYYHHSLPDDNPFLPDVYIKTLNNLKYIDPPLWLVARWGRFGANGTRVLPNFVVAKNARQFVDKVNSIPAAYHYFGLDFGFAESFNALISCCVDDREKVLYIYDEVYINNVTDDVFISREDVRRTAERAQRCEKPICADSSEPKTIQYYRQEGFSIYGCKKYVGSRLQNTKKMQRFKKIVCSPKCKNTIMELKDLTYKKDSRGNAIYDEFNIDPHTFKYHRLGVYKWMEKLERLKCQPERKLYCEWQYNTRNA